MIRSLITCTLLTFISNNSLMASSVFHENMPKRQSSAASHDSLTTQQRIEDTNAEKHAYAAKAETYGKDSIYGENVKLQKNGKLIEKTLDLLESNYKEQKKLEGKILSGAKLKTLKDNADTLNRNLKKLTDAYANMETAEKVARNRIDATIVADINKRLSAVEKQMQATQEEIDTKIGDVPPNIKASQAEIRKKLIDGQRQKLIAEAHGKIVAERNKVFEEKLKQIGMMEQMNEGRR
jgi:hypothetical protein